MYVPMDPKYLYFEREPTAKLALPDCLPEACESKAIGGCGLEELLCQRKEIIHLRARLVLSEIYQRQKLMEDNLYRICLDQCTCRNLIYLQRDDFLDKTRIDLERQIIGLEQEKRKEKGSYFRDILFLRKELREAVIEKLEEEQKTALFTDQEGE